MSMIKYLYSRIPQPLRNKLNRLRHWLDGWYHLLENSFYDTRRLAIHSLAINPRASRENKQAKLVFLYHKIEKAMTLPNPKPGFGSKWIPSDFIPLLVDYHNYYGHDELVSTCCVNLRSYLSFHTESGHHLGEIQDLILTILRKIGEPDSKTGGGAINVRAAQIHSAGAVDFERFVNNRHSIRNFTSEEVNKELIEKAIGLAQRTPSVCNRQAWHVYTFQKDDAILRALSHQNGNDGFKEKIRSLLMVTGDLSAMMGSYERNQIWIDGGMFSMSLVYALHSLKLGTCCLNLCHDAASDRRLRESLKIASNHSPIMMIAVGHIPESLRVANSHRKNVDQITTWV